VISGDGALTFYSDDREATPANGDKVVYFEPAKGQRKARPGLLRRLLAPLRPAPRAAGAKA
jgi:hypothetical protein